MQGAEHLCLHKSLASTETAVKNNLLQGDLQVSKISFQTMVFARKLRYCHSKTVDLTVLMWSLAY